MSYLLAMPPREADLYPPLKALLEDRGFEVKGEIGRCDVTAIREGEEPLLVELKLKLNLALLLQAADRLALTPRVYLGVPLGCAVVRKERKRLKKLLGLLGVGLISIDPEPVGGSGPGATAILLDPVPRDPRRSRVKAERLLQEFRAREGDPVAGGTDRRRGLMTAYRQRALRIAKHLESAGTEKASEVAREVGDAKARDILYRNVYGWFEGHGAGRYSLTELGREGLADWLDGGA